MRHQRYNYTHLSLNHASCFARILNYCAVSLINSQIRKLGLRLWNGARFSQRVQRDVANCRRMVTDLLPQTSAPLRRLNCK